MLLTHPTVGSPKLATRVEIPAQSRSVAASEKTRMPPEDALDREVLGGLLAAALGRPHQPHVRREPAHDVVGAVRRAVRGHDDLELAGIVLGQRVLELGRNAGFLIVHRDDVADRWSGGRLSHRPVAYRRQQRQRARITDVRIKDQRDRGPQHHFGHDTLRKSRQSSAIAIRSCSETRGWVGMVTRLDATRCADGNRQPAAASGTPGMSATVVG